MDARRSLVLDRYTARLVDVLVAWILTHFYLPGVILGTVYLAVADGMEGGRSLGKMALGLRVLEADGSPCTVRSSFLRNLPFVLLPVFLALGVFGWILVAVAELPLLAVEAWMVAEKDGGRLGDRVAGTRVVKARGTSST
jgi:uncharacterized RDD family membrane protein YckC